MQTRLNSRNRVPLDGPFHLSKQLLVAPSSIWKASTGLG